MSQFYKEIFLLADISMDITLEMLFVMLRNIEIDYISCHICWKTDIITKIILTTSKVELIEKKEFIAAAFDLRNKAFVVYVASISQN